MKRRNAKLEQRIILTALDNRSLKNRRVILAQTTPEMFDVAWAREVRKLMHLELQRGRDLPKAEYLAEMPALSESAQKFVKATAKKRKEARIRKRKEILRDIQELKRYVRIREALRGLLSGGKMLEDRVGDDELDQFCTILETTLSRVRQEVDQQPMVHYGRGQTKAQAKQMYRRLTTSSKHRFISTGMDAFDQHLGGHSRGNLVVISAPRKGGKSTLAINMAINQFLHHHLNVLYLSLEMPLIDVEQRIAAKESNMQFGSIRKPDELSDFQKKRIERFCKKLYKSGSRYGARFTIWPVVEHEFTPPSLYNAVEGMGYDMIYVDYLTLFHRKRLELWEMQLEYSRLLKQYAKKLDCVIGTLTQVNANDSVKYGTSVEENLDTWFRWPWREDEEEETGEVDLKLALCRHAPTATFPSVFALDKMTIHVHSPGKREKSGVKSSSRDADFMKRLRRGEI